VQDGSDVVAVALAARDDGALHARHGVLGQQLQDANELPRTRLGTVLPLQGTTQFPELRRQLPVPVDVGVIQRRRLPPQRHQVMQRIQHLHAPRIAPPVLGDHLTASDDGDVIHITLDGHRLEGEPPRHTIAVAIETHRLVLVHLARPLDGSIERSPGQRQGSGPIPLEALADGLRLAGLPPFPIAQAASAELGVQLVQVLDLGHRRRPLLLHELHPTFDPRLLLRPPHQAEQRLEVVVAGQGRITLMELTTPALE
jgi:hypothetical protein